MSEIVGTVGPFPKRATRCSGSARWSSTSGRSTRRPTASCASSSRWTASGSSRRARTSATSTAAPRSSSRPRPTRWSSRTPTASTTSRRATNNHAYVLAVEKLLGLEIPKRAQYIRVVLDEMQRISSHLLWLATAGDRPRRDHAVLLHVPRARGHPRPLRGLLRRAPHAQLHAHRRPRGGADARLDREAPRVHGGPRREDRRVRGAPDREPDLEGADDRRRHPQRRTAASSGASRGRRSAPPASSGTSGGRSRTSATRSSTSRSRRDRTPTRTTATSSGSPSCARAAGSSSSAATGSRRTRRARSAARSPRVIKPPAGDAYASVESPKGELGFYLVSNGGNKPYRLRVRPPSFINLQALPEMAKGHLVSDLVAIIGTIDIVLGEVDR